MVLTFLLPENGPGHRRFNHMLVSLRAPFDAPRFSLQARRAMSTRSVQGTI
jgi:hypothetical protein